MVANKGRFSWRLGRFNRLRPIRSLEDEITTSRPVQQPSFHVRLQLPGYSRCSANNCSNRRRLGTLLRLSGDAISRLALLRVTIHVLGAIHLMGAQVPGKSRYRYRTGNADRRNGWRTRWCHHLPPRRRKNPSSDSSQRTSRLTPRPRPQSSKTTHLHLLTEHSPPETRRHRPRDLVRLHGPQGHLPHRRHRRLVPRRGTSRSMDLYSERLHAVLVPTTLTPTRSYDAS